MGGRIEHVNFTELNDSIRVIAPIFSATAGVILGTTEAAPWAILPAMPRIISTLHSDPEREIRIDTG